MDVIDLIAADDDNDDDEPINLLDSDDERTERVQNQPSSTTILSSKKCFTAHKQVCFAQSTPPFLKWQSTDSSGEQKFCMV